MWQTIKTFFSAPLAKAGALTAVKVWQVALAVSIVAGTVGTYTYIQLTTPHNTPQHVIVFIGGLNTSMTNCHEDTFDDDTHSEILAYLLSQTAGIANPYVKGCNGLDPNQSYFSAPSSMIHFSYTGGAMDAHGFWKPNDYEPCSSVNNDPLAKDVQTFDAMLDKYRQTFPTAHFTLVGHSLGGLVSLQGAYDYVVNKGNLDIDKVVTIDSPLKGIQADSSTGSILAHLEAKTCSSGGHSGSVVTADLMALGRASINATHSDLQCDNPKDPRQAQLSWCKGQQLAQSGVGVVTLGNDQDSLFCSGLTQTVAGLDYRCSTQTLGTAHLVLSKVYDLTPLPTEGFAIAGLLDTAFGSGHFTLLSTPAREQEIIRYILAPVVTINQPTLQNASFTSTEGTALPFSATVRCLWGTANHATAQIALKDGSTRFVGTSTSTARSDTLTINGMANLPGSLMNTTATFYIEAGSDTCQYPASTDPQMHTKIVPQDTDYFGGKAAGVPFTLTTGLQSTPIYHPSSIPSPATPTSNSQLLAQSSALTVPAGQPFDVYFDYENVGNTNWTDMKSYQLVCDTKNIPGVNCMGGLPQGLNGIAVPPGSQSTFYVTLHAPLKAGTYETAWSMAQKGMTFGQGQIGMKVNVTTPVTVPMPATQTSCPTAGTAHAAVMEPLALGSHQNVVYIDNEGTSDQPVLGALRRYDVSANKTTTILSLPATSLYEAQISSDGQWILFAASMNGVAAIQMVRMDGQGLQTLYCTQAQRLSDIQWSPDQRSIAITIMVEYTSSPQTTILLLNTQDGQVRTLTSFQSPFSGCCIQLNWLDNIHLSIVGADGIVDTPDLGDPLILDTSRTGIRQRNDLQSLFHVSMPANGSDSTGEPCYDFTSSYDRTQIFVSQCTLTRYFPMASDEVIQQGPSSISVQSLTGGPLRTIYSNQRFAIAALQMISQTKLLFYVDNYTNHAGQSVDTSQNGLWTINTDGTGLTHLTTAAVGETVVFFFQVPPPTWLVISRDGSMYASSTSEHGNYGSRSLLFGSLKGGTPTTLLSRPGLPNGSITLVGWTSM